MLTRVKLSSETNKIYGAKRRHLAKEAGTCVRCLHTDAKALPGGRLCAACVQRGKDWYEERQRKGLCVKCNGVKDRRGRGSAICHACAFEEAAGRRAKVEIAKAANLCIVCRKVKTDDSDNTCRKCLFKAFSGRVFRTTQRWAELQQLFDKQNGCCAITGVPLKICSSKANDHWFAASLDHIVPRAQGGSNEISNLQWVSWLVNRAKSDMTHAQFLNLCTAVVAFALENNVVLDESDNEESGE